MSSRWRNRIIILAVIVGIIFLLRFTLFRPKPVEVSVYRVQHGRVEQTVTNSKAGTVKVRKRANLSPEIGGRVVYLDAEEGQRVRKGQLLLRLDDTEYKASLLLAEKAAEAAAANMREACVSADLARKEWQRNQTLHQQGIVSDAILDESSNRYEAARSRCEAAQADASRARANVEVSRAALKKTEVRAPFDGIIVEVTTEIGEWVTPSPPGLPIPPVIDMLDETGIYVEAPIDETDAAKLRTGQPTRISLDPYPDQTFPGTLTRMAPFVRDVEGQNRTVDVEAEFKDREFSKKLLPGTSADIEVILNSRENVLRIPAYALMEGSQVLMLVKDTLQARKVKTGLRNWDYVEIAEGLKEGDMITTSLERAEVKEGIKVKVTEEHTSK
ncbi:MAG TPA: efflux RND transporter periplasmic adaptor subunit [Acidobacteriota bacterium]|nr:efflux RND transporter periplasmic adaptor subunit [Acidobacteriota bacterium]